MCLFTRAQSHTRPLVLALLSRSRDYRDNMTELTGIGTMSKLKSLELLYGEAADLSEVGRGCPELESLVIIYMGKQRAMNLTEIGRGCSKLTLLILQNCENVTGLDEIGRGCANLTSLDASKSSVTDLSEIGRGCPKLTSLNISGCSVTDLSEIGRGYPELTSLNISGCSVTDLTEIGRGCSKLTSLDISGTGVTDLTEITRGCPKLTSFSIDSDPETLLKVVRAGSPSYIQSLDFECVGAHSFVLFARASLGATTRSHAPARARSLWFSQVFWRKADRRDTQRDHRGLSEHHQAQPQVRRRRVSLVIYHSPTRERALAWPSQVLQKADAKVL